MIVEMTCETCGRRYEVDMPKGMGEYERIHWNEDHRICDRCAGSYRKFHRKVDTDWTPTRNLPKNYDANKIGLGASDHDLED